MCRYIETEGVMPGWGCCHCENQSGDGSWQYNGIQRPRCRQCGQARCELLVDRKQTCLVDTNCVDGIEKDWFDIVDVSADKTFHFCPRHALAAEALTEFGMRGPLIAQTLHRIEGAK